VAEEKFGEFASRAISRMVAVICPERQRELQRGEERNEVSTAEFPRAPKILFQKIKSC